MKKIIIPIVLICVIAGVFCISYVRNRIPDEKIRLKISSLTVENCENGIIERAQRSGCILPEDISRLPEKYKVIEMYCLIENNSDKTEMQDVRIHPRLGKRTAAYNSGNGEHYIMIEPMSRSGMRQYIFVESADEDNSKLYTDILKEHIEVTCYTEGLSGLLTLNTGHGLTGAGKYKYDFVIGDSIAE